MRFVETLVETLRKTELGIKGAYLTFAMRTEWGPRVFDWWLRERMEEEERFGEHRSLVVHVLADVSG